MVSRSHGRVRATSAWPPQRSTTVSPSTTTATAAPISSPSRRWAAKASRTGAKRGWQCPRTGGRSDMGVRIAPARRPCPPNRWSSSPDRGILRCRGAAALTDPIALRDSPAVDGTPPAAQRFAWLRFLHQPLAAVGLVAIEPSAWPVYLTVLVVLALEWPFHIQLADDLETYPPAEWTAASAAYVLGFALLPIFWLSAALGFGLIVLLDGYGIVGARGLAADSARWIRGRPPPAGVTVDGHLRGF